MSAPDKDIGSQDTGSQDTGSPLRRAAVVLNPVKVADQAVYRDTVDRAMRDAGWSAPLWLETTPEETGRAQAAEAIRAGTEIVFACGGDGTVAACAAALAGTDVPLAVLPTGTGNLLAANLGLPSRLADGLAVGLGGTNRRIDLGVLDGERRFTVMAGVGLDAAMVADASEELKRRIGWIAYPASAARHLMDRRIRMAIRLDGGPVLRRRARAVLIANVGRVQGGIRIIPGAEADDGMLDVLVVGARGPADLARVAWRLLHGRRRSDRRAEFFRARRVQVRTRTPAPYEMDGEHLGSTTRMDVHIDPGALVVRVPQAPITTAHGPATAGPEAA